MDELENKIFQINEYGHLFQTIIGSIKTKYSLLSKEHYLDKDKFKMIMSNIIDTKSLFKTEEETKIYNPYLLTISFLKILEYIFRKMQSIEEKIITLRNQKKLEKKTTPYNLTYNVFKKLEGELSIMLVELQLPKNHDSAIDKLYKKYNEIMITAYKNEQEILKQNKETNPLIIKLAKDKKNIAAFFLSIITFKKK